MDRVQIAETIQQDCGFPGVFGALDAALVHIRPPPTAPADIQNYAYSMERETKVVMGMEDNPKQLERELVTTGSNNNTSTMDLEERELVRTRDKKGKARAKEGSFEELGHAKCALVLQFVADHKLIFRDIHLDAPKTGTRMQVFQVSCSGQKSGPFLCEDLPLLPLLNVPIVHAVKVLKA